MINEETKIHTCALDFYSTVKDGFISYSIDISSTKNILLNEIITNIYFVPAGAGYFDDRPTFGGEIYLSNNNKPYKIYICQLEVDVLEIMYGHNKDVDDYITKYIIKYHKYIHRTNPWSMSIILGAAQNNA